MRRWLGLAALALTGCAADKGPQPPYIVNVSTVPAPTPNRSTPRNMYAANFPEAFRKCMACHTSARGGPHGIGPNLWGLYGKPAGTRPGYRFSDQLRVESDNGLVWNRETLDRWLANPRAMVPGTKMVFQGLADPQQRQAIIAYLVRLR